MANEGKIFNDPVHGNISIHPLCIKIMDTPEFQRLRQIKQLGAVQFVYPGATHSRFEHSIGTCFLAREWFNHLRERLPEDCVGAITDKDGLCVAVAGLCHDLGHGPLSHMFDKFYMKQVKAFEDVTHESLSVHMLRYLITQNNLMPVFQQYGLEEDDVTLIGDIINPGIGKHGEEYQRLKKRMFLYEIVNNSKNGIDVDKWDYFARDCLHVNITNSFDYWRLVKFSRVLVGEDGATHICFRDKEAENLYKMFELRYDLHRQVYSHKVTHVIHIMIADALLRADRCLESLIPAVARNNILTTAASCVNDMKIFSQLTDTTIWQILQSERAELAEPQRILRDIYSRRFYPSFRTCPSGRKPENEIGIRDDLAELANLELQKANLNELTDQNKKDIIVLFIKLDYSKGEDDPVHDVNFYEKSKPTKMIKLPEHKKLRLAPRQFCQHIVSVCWKNLKHDEVPNRQIVQCLRSAFGEWCKTHGYSPYD